MRSFSKLIIAKFLNERANFFIKKFAFNVNDGYHQLFKNFNGNIMLAIQNLHLPDTDGNWDKKREAERVIGNLIEKIVAYGDQETCRNILTNFDLYNTLRKEKVT